jgi:hypothetical protein
MVLNREGADDRRDRLLDGFLLGPGSTETTTPPLWKEASPTATYADSFEGSTRSGWMADVAYVPSSDNSSHGSSLGGKLRGFCEGTRFKYAFA